MANIKPFNVSQDPIQLIRDSGVPLRLQDIAKLCNGDRRQILRRIESVKRKEFAEMRDFFLSVGDSFDDVGEDNAEKISLPFPYYLHFIRVRKGFPLQLIIDEDFATIRKKWMIHGNEANNNPKSYERLWCSYIVMRQIKSIRKTPLPFRSKIDRAYPLRRKGTLDIIKAFQTAGEDKSVA
jgi:hypothetical protein